jgi:hypothetical protein
LAFEELKIELNELVLESTPIEVTGFSRIDIEQINLDVEPAPHETGPLAPEPTLVPVSRLGDVFGLGDHLLVCGDSTDPDVIKLLRRRLGPLGTAGSCYDRLQMIRNDALRLV